MKLQSFFYSLLVVMYASATDLISEHVDLHLLAACALTAYFESDLGFLIAVRVINRYFIQTLAPALCVCVRACVFVYVLVT